jgi:hypothetical protein
LESHRREKLVDAVGYKFAGFDTKGKEAALAAIRATFSKQPKRANDNALIAAIIASHSERATRKIERFRAGT